MKPDPSQITTTHQPSNLILASQSPRRRMLLTNAGYRFVVDSPDEAVEQAVPRIQNSADRDVGNVISYVADVALAKAQFVAGRHASAVILAADTVALCDKEVLGKAANRDAARRMLKFLSGREHDVFTGVCLWHRPSDLHLVHVERTRLRMDKLTDVQIEEYLESNAWVGKAGAFGYQDGWDWLHVVDGSESNVVGLPLERLPEMFAKLQALVPSNSWS